MEKKNLISLYPTLSVAHFRATETLLKQWVFLVGKEAEDKDWRSFRINPDGSYLYTDKANEALIPLEAPTLKEEPDAIACGQKFLDKLKKATEIVPFLQNALGTRGLQLLPDMVYFDRIERVFRKPITINADNQLEGDYYWRAHYIMRLRPQADADPVPVQGRKVEIDFTWGGSILRVYSNILPTLTLKKVKKVQIPDLEKLLQKKDTTLSQPTALSKGRAAPITNPESPITYLECTHYAYTEGYYHPVAMTSEGGVGLTEVGMRKGRQVINLKSPQGLNSAKDNKPININRIVWRIGSLDKEIETFTFVNEDGTAIKYTEKDNSYQIGLSDSDIILPRGTKVIELEDSTTNDTLRRIILFWKGRYREGYIEKRAFETYVYEHPVAIKEIFINDIERLVFNIHNFEFPLGRFPIVAAAFLELSKLLAEKAKLDENKLIQAIEDYNTTYNVLYPHLNPNINNSVEIYQKHIDFLNLTLGNYLKIQNYLILPITKDWVVKYYPDYYKEYIQNSSLEGNFNLDVGDVISNVEGDELYILLDSFLSHVVKNNFSPSLTLEHKWIIENYERFKKCKFILMLGNGVLRISVNAKYAGLIGLENSFSSLFANNVQTIFIHEFDQGGNEYLPGDTHIQSGLDSSSEDTTMGVYKNLIVGNDSLNSLLSEKFSEEKSYFFEGKTTYYSVEIQRLKLDMLYQSITFHGIIFLSSFLKKYNILIFLISFMFFSSCEVLKSNQSKIPSTCKNFFLKPDSVIFLPVTKVGKNCYEVVLSDFFYNFENLNQKTCISLTWSDTTNSSSLRIKTNHTLKKSMEINHEILTVKHFSLHPYTSFNINYDSFHSGGELYFDIIFLVKYYKVSQNFFRLCITFSNNKTKWLYFCLL